MKVESPFTDMPEEMSGLYFINRKLWIISDHPNAAKWREEYPDMPSATLAELERMPRIEEPARIHKI